MEPFVCRSDAGLGQDNGIRDNAALPVLQRRGGPGSPEPSRAPAGGGFSGIAPRQRSAVPGRARGNPSRGLGLSPGRGPCAGAEPGEGSLPWGCARRGLPALGGALPARRLCLGGARCLPGGSIPARPSPEKGGSGEGGISWRPQSPRRAGAGDFPGSPFLPREASGKGQVWVRSWGSGEGAVI